MTDPETKKKSNVFVRMIKRFWPDILKLRLLILGSFLALFGDICMRLLEPWPLKFIFDRLTSGSNYSSSMSMIDKLDPISLVVYAGLAIIIFAGLRGIMAYWSTIGLALVGNRITTHIRNELYSHIQSLPISFHTKARSGDLLMLILGDITVLKNVIVNAALPLFSSILVLFGMLVVMFCVNWQLALVPLIVIPVFGYVTWRQGSKILDTARNQRRNESALAATASESIGAIKTVKTLSLEDAFSESFFTDSFKSLDEGVKGIRLGTILERTVDMLIAISTAIVLGFGTLLVLRHELTPGDLIVYLAYLKNAFKPARNFTKYSSRLAKAAASAERVMDLFELTPDVSDHPDAVPAPAFKGKVRFENVTFGYEPGHPILKSINLEVLPGQRLVLVGSSGTGKSSLVNLVLRLYDPNTGGIFIDDKDIRSYTVESLRLQISVVQQDSILFAVSIRDNIAYGAPDDANFEDIKAAARLANAHDFIEALPNGYDTMTGERGLTLSNGQRQRIAIARAAIRKSPILIQDEPTTGLDKENEHEVADALEKLAQGKTTFYITHNLNLITPADRILFLENGRVKESGSHEELMKAKGSYAALYHLNQEALDKKTVLGTSHADTL